MTTESTACDLFLTGGIYLIVVLLLVALLLARVASPISRPRNACSRASSSRARGVAAAPTSRQPSTLPACHSSPAPSPLATRPRDGARSGTLTQGWPKG